RARDDGSCQPREPEALRFVDRLAVDGHVRRQPNPAIVPWGFRIPLLGELQPPGREWHSLRQPQPGVILDGHPLDTEHQEGEVHFAGLQHRQARRAVWHSLHDDALDRWFLPPVLLVRLKHQFHAGSHPNEAIGTEADRLTLPAFLPDLFDVLPGGDPRSAGRRRRVEDQEVGPGRVQHEPHPVLVGNLHGLYSLVKQLARDAPVTLEGKLHIVGREGIAIVKLEALAELELVYEPVRAFPPRLRQTRRHVVTWQGLGQGVVQRVQELEQGAEDRGLRGIEKRGSYRGVEGDRQLAFRWALRLDL